MASTNLFGEQQTTKVNQNSKFQQFINFCQGRIVQNVPEPVAHLLTKDEIYGSDGLPKHEVLREHLKMEGRLTPEAALAILTQGKFYILNHLDLEIILLPKFIGKYVENLGTEILTKEPNLLSVKAPITVVGDIHGQYFDLLKMFEVGGVPGNGADNTRNGLKKLITINFHFESHFITVF